MGRGRGLLLKKKEEGKRKQSVTPNLQKKREGGNKSVSKQDELWLVSSFSSETHLSDSCCFDTDHPTHTVHHIGISLFQKKERQVNKGTKESLDEEREVREVRAVWRAVWRFSSWFFSFLPNPLFFFLCFGKD